MAMLIAGLHGSRSLLPSPTVVDRLLPALLGGYWAWLGVVFMWGCQGDLSASGRPFGALFLISAVAFGVAAFAGTDLGLGRVPSWRLAIGGSMIVYGMLFYSLLGALAGHTHPSAPIFGVAPCPTAIFTFGVLAPATTASWSQQEGTRRKADSFLSRENRRGR